MSQKYQPIFIMPEGSDRTSGRDAQKGNMAAAMAVADTVRTTLGPKGMDKMLVNAIGDVIITNDGYTIVDEMAIEHPAAKMIVEIAKTQQDEVGDGTTTAVILAGELLKNAESLITSDVHPTVINRGYRMASEKAIQILNELSLVVKKSDSETLKSIATTAMTGKSAEMVRKELSAMIVKSVQQTYGDTFDAKNIKIEKKVGGGSEDSELIEGIVLNKEKVHASMPKSIANAKIAIVNKEFEIKKGEIDSNIEIKDPASLSAFVDLEEQMLKDMSIRVVNCGANVLFCQKGIDDSVKHYLSKAGIFAIERVSEDDAKMIAKATGAKIVNSLKALSADDLGFSGMVDERKLGNENYVFISKCKNPMAVTILLRGGTQHVLDELERAVTDAIGDVGAAIAIGKAVGGAGSIEIELSARIRKYADTLTGREQLAVNAFADSLEVVPRTLAENAGLDPIDVMTELKAAHSKGQIWAGVNVDTGKVMDAWKSGVIEPLRVKTQAIAAASEVAELILRIDDVISSGKRGNPGMPQGGMGMDY